MKNVKAPTSNQNTINAKINLLSNSPIPSTIISTDGLKNPERMMIDTGAGRNLIKLNIIDHDVGINQNEVSRYTGINNVPVYTLGQITFDIFGYPTIFNLIPNSVTVKEDGVLGPYLFTDNDVNINYISKCLKINDNKYPFRNPESTILPAENAIVKNHTGKAYIKVAKILSVPVEKE